MTRQYAALLASIFFTAPVMVHAAAPLPPTATPAGAPRCNVSFTAQPDFSITSRGQAQQAAPVFLSADQVEMLKVNLAIADAQEASAAGAEAAARDGAASMPFVIATATPLHCVGWAYASW